MHIYTLNSCKELGKKLDIKNKMQFSYQDEEDEDDNKKDESEESEYAEDSDFEDDSD